MVQKLVLTETKTSVILEIPRTLLRRAGAVVSKNTNVKQPFKTIARSEKEFQTGRAKLLSGSLLGLIK